MNKMKSIIRDANHGIQLNLSRQSILAASYSLQQSELIGTENKLRMLELWMANTLTGKALVEFKAIAR